MDTCKYELNYANTTLPNCVNGTFIATNGLNKIVMWVNDSVNNNVTVSVYFTVNNVTGSIGLSSPLNTTYINATVNVNYTISKYMDTCFMELDGVNYTLLCRNATLTQTNISDGSHTLIIYTNDTAGSAWQSLRVYFTFSHILQLSVIPNQTAYAVGSIANISGILRWENGTFVSGNISSAWINTTGEIAAIINSTSSNGLYYVNYQVNTTGLWQVNFTGFFNRTINITNTTSIDVLIVRTGNATLKITFGQGIVGTDFRIIVNWSSPPNATNPIYFNATNQTAAIFLLNLTNNGTGNDWLFMKINVSNYNTRTECFNGAYGSNPLNLTTTYQILQYNLLPNTSALVWCRKWINSSNYGVQPWKFQFLI